MRGPRGAAASSSDPVDFGGLFACECRDFVVAGAWSLWLGIRSINARIFQYFLLCVPIPIVSELALADGKITRLEGVALILVDIAFVGSTWWFAGSEFAAGK